MIFVYLSIILLLLIIYMPYWIKIYQLKCWFRTLHIKQHLAVFQEIFRDVDGFALSRVARRSQDAMEYTYGEIEFVSFIALIAMTHPTHKTRFYDLGSGTGKAVIACAMVFDMRECCGVELFKELYDASLKQQHKLQQLSTYTKKADTIRFIHDNFLNAEFHNASLIFINASALFGETWEQLNHRLITETLPNTLIITTSKPLITSATYIVIKTTQVNMSWGIVTAYIHAHHATSSDS